MKKISFEELLQTEALNLVDASFFSLPSDFLNKLYDCRSLDCFSSESIEEAISISQEDFQNSLDGNFYSIPEVAIEKGLLSEKINSSLKWFKKGSKKLDTHSYSKQKGFKEDELVKLNYNLLNSLVVSNEKLVKRLQEKDITKTFSPLQKDIYRRLTDYFINTSERYNLKRDFSKDHFKSKYNEDLQTDEKLVAAACTMAKFQPVNLITSDSDLKGLLKFTKNHLLFVYSSENILRLCSDYTHEKNFDVLEFFNYSENHMHSLQQLPLAQRQQ